LLVGLTPIVEGWRLDGGDEIHPRIFVLPFE
jgi:hypothetical protein